MENAPAFHPLDHVSVLRRRMWWLIVPAVVVMILGAGVIAMLPRSYESTATLGISLPTMGGQVVSDAQRLTPQERVRSFNQVLLSPPVLERVVKTEGLDKTMSKEDAIAMIGGNASVSLPAPDPNVPQGNVEVFYLKYVARNPGLSARVANRLAEVFVDESSKKREVRAEETSAFIEEQVKGSQERLADLEGKLRTAKEGFMGSLPEQTQANVAILNSSQQQLQATSNQLRGEVDHLAWIERELSGAKPQVADPSIPGGRTAATTLSPKALRVVELEKALQTAKATFTDNYPDVIDLKEQLQKAKAEAATEAALPEAEREAQMRTDPAYTALLKERDQAKQNITNLQRQQQAYNDSIAHYTSRVDTAPRVEQALASLQRETDLERQRYTLLTQKLNDARITEAVEQNRGSEHFTIIARAAAPDAPASPNVPRLMIMVVLLGLCLGGSLALGREYLDRSIHDARALNDLELPVLGEIPRISHV
jgi:polysaccharide chain length determinant protein (PEP-CTERM system associated)